jgi:prepilin-type N-terminal cleavage/methylation domain-containing protein
MTVRHDGIDAAPGTAPGAAFRFHRRGGDRGFSLVELMVAMAIFSVIGVALIALLRQSTAFLEKGQAGSEVQDVLENLDRQFADDFANVYIKPASMEGVPDVRLTCDRIPFDTDGDGIDDVQTQRLSFVRSVPGEGADPVLRAAGTRAGATASVDGEDDAKEAEDGDLRPAGGKQEVTFVLVPWKKAPEGRKAVAAQAAPAAAPIPDEPGLMTLYRGVRMPVGGGTKSFLPLEPVPESGARRKEGARLGITTREEAVERLRPLNSAVLHLSFAFWSRQVRPEAARLVVAGRLADEVAPDRNGGGLSPFWDSTRGIYPRGTGPLQFFLAKGPESLADPVDDVFPSQVRMTLVVDRLGRDAATGELARTIGPDDSVIPVSSTRFAQGSDPAGRFIKIGREWIQWSDRDARGFVVEKRGVRGTRKEAHDAGDTVRAGVTLVRDYPIPSFREDWND